MCGCVCVHFRPLLIAVFIAKQYKESSFCLVFRWVFAFFFSFFGSLMVFFGDFWPSTTTNSWYFFINPTFQKILIKNPVLNFIPSFDTRMLNRNDDESRHIFWWQINIFFFSNLKWKIFHNELMCDHISNWMSVSVCAGALQQKTCANSMFMISRVPHKSRT